LKFRDATLLIFAAAQMIGCAAQQPLPPAAQTHCPFCDATPASASIEDLAAGMSLYDRDWLWQDDSGRDFKLSELKGRPEAVAVYFSACAGI